MYVSNLNVSFFYPNFLKIEKLAQIILKFYSQSFNYWFHTKFHWKLVGSTQSLLLT